MRDFADEVCLRAREVDSELVGSGLQRISPDGELLAYVRTIKQIG